MKTIYLAVGFILTSAVVYAGLNTDVCGQNRDCQAASIAITNPNAGTTSVSLPLNTCLAGDGTLGELTPGANGCLYFDGTSWNIPSIKTDGGFSLKQTQGGSATLSSGKVDAGFAAAFTATPKCACSLTAIDAGEIVACIGSNTAWIQIVSNNAGSTSVVNYICSN